LCSLNVAFSLALQAKKMLCTYNNLLPVLRFLWIRDQQTIYNLL